MKKIDFKISKDKIKNIANDIGEKTKNLAEDLGEKTKDVVGTVGEATKKAVTNIKESSEELGKQIDKAKLDNDKKRLRPFFAEDISEPGFKMPAMIRIVGNDKRRNNKACEGAIGFEVVTKNMRVLNIYSEYVDLFNLKFYPNKSETVYYIDPCYKDLYIILEDYFSYLKKVRVDELQTIAQDLGAKHMRIALKEINSSSQNKNLKLSAGVNIAGANEQYAMQQTELTKLEVASEVDFVGKSEPVKPKLNYFKNESDVVALVKMRLNSKSKNDILSKTYSFKYSNSSGIKLTEAANINEALTEMNISLGKEIKKEALTENRTMLEYSIEF